MTSRVAILTDVHGNADALRAVLEHIDSAPPHDRIYSLGDMISIGPDSHEVLEALFSRTDIDMLVGNHEDAVLTAWEGKDPGTPGTERLHQEWIASRLSSEWVERIRVLPRHLERVHDGQHLLLLHYHEDRDGKYLPVDLEPSAATLDVLYDNSHADAVCFGHHHPVHLFRSARRLYLNPGSLGCSYEPVARYATLVCTEGGVDVQLHAVPYDNRRFLASYKTLDVPAGEFILKTFHGNQHLKHS